MYKTWITNCVHIIFILNIVRYDQRLSLFPITLMKRRTEISNKFRDMKNETTKRVMNISRKPE